jgi:formate/nitrite transporter FocA (FNT family)
MYYSLGQDLTFVVLTFISALSLLNQHELLAIIFCVLALAFISFEHQIADYVKNV